jgi:predicted extracellular nuclease
MKISLSDLIRRKLAVTLLSLVIIAPSVFAQTQDTLFIGEWNVENLFDTVNDPGKNDKEFTPGSKKHWTEKRLDEKISHLRKVLSTMNNSKGPDIFGFEEVEHKALLKKIVAGISGRNYGIVYAESPDFRGIDNGIIYDKDKFKLDGMDTLRVKVGGHRTTRYILYARLLTANGDTLNVFDNHWPSRYGGQARSEPGRVSAAQTLRNYLCKTNMSRNIIVMGDFNDEPGDASILYVLSAKPGLKKTVKPTDFVNLSYPLYAQGEGSLTYRWDWNMLDQIIVSQNLLTGNKITYIKNSFEIIKFPFMVEQKGKYKGNPFRTFAGNHYLGGYSDHFPVAAKFIVK